MGTPASALLQSIVDRFERLEEMDFDEKSIQWVAWSLISRTICAEFETFLPTSPSRPFWSYHLQSVASAADEPRAESAAEPAATDIASCRSAMARRHREDEFEDDEFEMSLRLQAAALSTGCCQRPLWVVRR